MTKHSAISEGRQDDSGPRRVVAGADRVGATGVADGLTPDGSAPDGSIDHGSVADASQSVGEDPDVELTPADAPEGDAKRTKKKQSSGARDLLDWIVVIGAALAIAILIRTFVMAHFRVEGNSMLDTVHPGDRVFVNKLSYRFGEPSRGDVVVLHELQGERDLIKRVIALPGETIEIRDCQVIVDGEVQPEPYLSDAVRADRGWCELDPVTVPDDSLFVMGDNRPASADSRYFGPIPESDVVGRAFVIFWPITDASGL